MAMPEEVEYRVVLVFPGFGSERENAESIVESALEWLNTHKETPGFRFSPDVSASLELAQDADEARARISEDERVAMVIVHDVPEDERDALLRHCLKRNMGVCYTVDAPRPARRRKGPLQVVFRDRPSDELPAHKLVAQTLTAPLEDEEETADRAGELVAVLALGIMGYHWEKRPHG
jgi:hypothetical protein